MADRFSDLSVDKKVKVYHVGKDLGLVPKEIPHYYNYLDSLDNIVKQANPRFRQRLDEDTVRYVNDYEHPGYKASHKMAYADSNVYPLVQEIGGRLLDLSAPGATNVSPYTIAVSDRNFVELGKEEDAENYSKYYKLLFPQHFGPKEYFPTEEKTLPSDNARIVPNRPKNILKIKAEIEEELSKQPKAGYIVLPPRCAPSKNYSKIF